MKALYLLLMLPGLWFCSVNMAPGANGPAKMYLKDTLAYKYQTAKERAPDCGTRPDSECTVAKVKFPVFYTEDVLNKEVQHKVSALFNFGGLKIHTIIELNHSVIKAYLADEDFIRDHGFYLLDAYCKVVRQDGRLLICEIAGYSYSGGAHGIDETAFLNWDRLKQREVTLNDILRPGCLGQLTKKGEMIFRKDEKLNADASLTDRYFFKNGEFCLNDNFMITPTGLQFLYNDYEIKSFAAGQTKLFIPYSQIKSLLRPNSVVSQYIK